MTRFQVSTKRVAREWSLCRLERLVIDPPQVEGGGNFHSGKWGSLIRLGSKKKNRMSAGWGAHEELKTLTIENRLRTLSGGNLDGRKQVRESLLEKC